MRFLMLACITACSSVSIIPAPTSPKSTNAASSKSPDHYRWRLDEIFPTTEAWHARALEVTGRIENLAKATTGLDRPQELYVAVHEFFAIRKQVDDLYYFAKLRALRDARDSEAQQLEQRVNLLEGKLDKSAESLKASVVLLGQAKLTSFLEAEPKLHDYQRFLRKTLADKLRSGGTEVKEIAPELQPILAFPKSMYHVLSTVEMPWESIPDSKGREIVIDGVGYQRAKSSPDRAFRERAMHAYWRGWQRFEQTMGLLLNASVQGEIFRTRKQKFNTTLERVLSRDAVPIEVYRTLIAETKRNSGLFHRAWELQSQALGLSHLGYHDLHANSVPSNKRLMLQEAVQLLTASLAPLGPQITDTVKHGLENHWMDAFPRKGKRQTNFTLFGPYDGHPYIMLNYVGDFISLSAFAHEWGHALHAYFTNRSQAQPNTYIPSLLTEVAAFFNEFMLFEHLIRQATDKRERLYYLSAVLSRLNTIFFRQVVFAEFEQRIFEKAEGGQPLNGDLFTDEYLGLLREYYGHAKGVVDIPADCGIEWAYISTFFRNPFLVYTYATSAAVAVILAEGAITGDPQAQDAYLRLLSAGDSKDAYLLLKELGVDLNSAESYQPLMSYVRRMLERMEEMHEMAASAER